MASSKVLPKATKRNSVEIAGQLWHFKVDRYWSPDTAGGSTEKAMVATRYSDGKSVTGSSKDRLIAVIAERIANGSY
jgi:hypothetical protein